MIEPTEIPQTEGGLPLNVLLRQRRQILHLRQGQIAEALGVTVESIRLWERADRRLELSRLPRVAAILQLDAERLCRQALAEYYPALHAILFKNKEVAQTIT